MWADTARGLAHDNDLVNSQPSMPGWCDEQIRLAESDPAWPVSFQAESALLDAAIGAWITGGIHHVGSTAVPGRAAKPIIDILVGLRTSTVPGRA